MTEQEAKAKWCPFARVAFGWNEALRDSEQAVAATVNRGDNLSAHTSCIGSACMAWRWDENEPLCEHGHCGLAGKP